MRDSPLLQTLIVAACPGLLPVPLTRLTTPKPALSGSPEDVGSEPAAHREEKLPCTITLQFAHPPISASLKCEDIVLWTGGDGAETRFDIRADVPFFDHAAEMAIEVQWPDDTPRSVAEIELAPDMHASAKQTAWGTGSLSEHLVFDLN